MRLFLKSYSLSSTNRRCYIPTSIISFRSIRRCERYIHGIFTVYSCEYRIVKCTLGSNGNGGGTAKSVVPGFVLIRKSIIPVPRVGDERTQGGRGRERQRGGEKMAARREIRHQIEGDAIAKRGAAPLSLDLGFGHGVIPALHWWIGIIVIILSHVSYTSYNLSSFIPLPNDWKIIETAS